MRPPLTDLWSGYSLLRSLYQIPELVNDLKTRGYQAAALTDWETLAGTEEFDRLMRAAGLTPFLGVSRAWVAGGHVREVRLIAETPEAWSALVNFAAWTGRERIAGLTVVLGASDDPWWESGLGLEGPVVVELMPDQASSVAKLPHGWRWVPATRVRFPQATDREAHRILGEIGGLAPDGRAVALPARGDTWWAPYQDWPTDQLWNPADGGSVLPDRAWKMVRVTDSLTAEFAKLRADAWAGLAARFPQGMTPEGRERLEYELAVIDRLGFPGYFLMVADVVQWARSAGIRVGPGRGSAAGSLVSYALGITDIDPLRYGLVFERFLNPARRTLPDIDLDFEDVRRSEVLRYLRLRYGVERVAQIGTYGTLGARAVLRDVARVLNLPAEHVNAVMRSVDWSVADRLADHRATLEQASQRTGLGSGWLDLAARLEGLPRHRSTHAAGVIIAPEPLQQWVYCHGDAQGLVTDFDMGSMERLGFVKLDVLGLRTLSLLSRIEDLAGLDASLMAAVDGQDLKTLKLLGRGDTDGVFQLDGKGVKRLLRQMRPRSREEVMMASALYRPGPMEAIGELLKRRASGYAGSGDPLDALLRETYGVMVYQEQLMAAVQQVGGLTLAEADLVRRAISKKDHALLAEEGERIMANMRASGYTAAQATAFWDKIRAFGDYGFNKSHAVSYGTISFYAAYLKAHYPTAFWAAELSSHDNPERLSELMRQAVSQGIALHRPHVNHSGRGFTLEGTALRAGLGLIRGIGHETARRLVEERDRGGLFQDVRDVERRMGQSLGQRGMEALAAAGALDGLGPVRRAAQQMQLFEAEDTAQSGAVLADDRAAFGFLWPHADGPIFVRLAEPPDPTEVAERVRALARHWAGSVPVAIIQSGNKAVRIPGVTIRADVEAIQAIKEVDGVLAAGRQVSDAPPAMR